MISHIDHIVLTVADIERSVAFYARVLGMQAVSFGNGRRALQFGQQKINLQTLGMEPRTHAAVGAGDVCLITDWPTARVLARLAAEGGPVMKSGAQGPIESVYFNDPDGHLIEVSRYPD